MSVLPEIPESVKDKASDVLLNMVNVTIQTMNDVVAFGKQQIPEVVNQLLMWKAVESAITFGIYLVFLLIGALLITRWSKRAGQVLGEHRQKALDAYKNGERWTRFYRDSDHTSTSYDFLMFGTLVGKWCVLSVGILVSLTALSAALHELAWLKIWIAPKVYLIEYAAEMIKK